ncbi:MAG: EscU/YscU/HrcU family type III secretion system export apparatus switch protein [Candidatus Margulisiibacteriota bacterium]
MVNIQENDKKKPSQEDEDERSGKLAIAMNYDIERPDMAPLVTAAGKGKIAQEIIRIAEENKVPLYEDRSLANLLSKLELDTEVPPELYILVAEVLAFVYRLDRMSQKREDIREKMKRSDK